MAGDFNCRVGSRFYDSVVKFVENNKLLVTDSCRLKDVFTHCSDSAATTTWIDHILCSRTDDNLVSSCRVEYQYVSSDHRPLFTSFDAFLKQPNIFSSSTNSPTDWSLFLFFLLSGRASPALRPYMTGPMRIPAI